MESVVSIVLAVAGSMLSSLTVLLFRLKRKRDRVDMETGSTRSTFEVLGNLPRDAGPRKRRLPSELPVGKIKPGTAVLWIFAALVFIFGTITMIRYWEQLKAGQDTALFGGWLFLSMVGGMFVQVLTTNYRSGKPLFDVTASQLAFPLLFSVIVYYPIWVIGASATDSAFAIYAAFLNGFFWETVVTNAKLVPVATADGSDSE